MRSFSRTAVIFFAVLGVIFSADWFARHVLQLNCMGPILPAWGCLAEPWPTTFTDIGSASGSLLFYTAVVAGLIVLAFVLRDLVFGAVGFVIGKWKPEWIAKMAPKEEPRSYRVR